METGEKRRGGAKTLIYTSRESETVRKEVEETKEGKERKRDSINILYACLVKTGSVQIIFEWSP